jgi:hypothetical protein
MKDGWDVWMLFTERPPDRFDLFADACHFLPRRMGMLESAGVGAIAGSGCAIFQ